MPSERHVVQTTLDGFDRPVGPPPPPPPRHRTPNLTDPNPCVVVHGHGPEGATCASCGSLVHGGTRGEHLKCTLRGVSSSERTDHRAGWPACGRYVVRRPLTEAAVRRVVARTLDVPGSAVTLTTTETGWVAQVGRGRLTVAPGYATAWWDVPGQVGQCVFLAGGELGGAGDDEGGGSS